MENTEPVRNLAGLPPFTGAGGALIQELAGRSTGLTSHSLARITHPAGTASLDHHHTVADEIYFVASGHARCRVDGSIHHLGPGDILLIRPGQHHKLWNDGPADLVLLVTCSPAYQVSEVVWDE